jgi:hypothetical protein
MRFVTGVAATNVLTTKDEQDRPVNHGLIVGQRVILEGLAGGTGLTSGSTYYVRTIPSDSTLTVSETAGGAEKDFSSNLTAGTLRRRIRLPRRYGPA